LQAQEAKSGAAVIKAGTPESFVSTHAVVVNGQPIRYEARAEATILPNAKGEPAASLFTFSYLRQGVKDSAVRPVIFLFNGGPGSSSVWLHMSGLAPRRVDFGRVSGINTAPPFHLVDSDFSVIDAADLVFIDPVGTGFSKLLPGGRTEDFFGLREDARSIADFIRIWSTKYHRWNSPKYLLGESYGTHRIAAMMTALNTGAVTIPINGIILLGQALDMTATNPNPGNDMSCELILPSLAAAAWYHGKVDKTGTTFAQFLDDARRFASTGYAAALFAGSQLSEQERAKTAHQLARFTGIEEPVLLHWGLRVTRVQFLKALLSDEDEVLAADDGRFTTKVPEGDVDSGSIDPFLEQVTPAVTSALRTYMQAELGVDTSDTYNVIGPDITMAKWNWDTGAPGTARFYFNLTPMIALAMRENPALRLMVGAGYYDLLTPFFSAEHTVSHSGIPIDRVEIKYYESGHMPYVGDASAKQLTSDIRTFVTGTH
jgi:carboxypeptidase C (cathepsin A)